MNKGMLWYDNNTKLNIENRVLEAVEFFMDKYGYKPHCAFVNPTMAEKPIKIKNNIKIVPNEKILKNHIWLEMAQEE